MPSILLPRLAAFTLPVYRFALAGVAAEPDYHAEAIVKRRRAIVQR